MTIPAPSYMEELLRTYPGGVEALRAAVLENDSPLVGALIEALPEERGPCLGITIGLLGEARDRRAVVPLIEVLLREDWPARPLTAFWDRVIYWVSPYLRRLIRETAETERVAARTITARVLAQFGDPRAVGALMAIRNDQDERVRSAVEKALDQLEALAAPGSADQPSLPPTG